MKFNFADLVVNFIGTGMDGIKAALGDINTQISNATAAIQAMGAASNLATANAAGGMSAMAQAARGVSSTVSGVTDEIEGIGKAFRSVNQIAEVVGGALAGRFKEAKGLFDRALSINAAPALKAATEEILRQVGALHG